MKKLLIIPLILNLGACVTEDYFTNPQAAQDSIQCETDDFNSMTTCNMPEKTTCSDDGSDSVMNCVGNRTYAKLKTVYNEKTQVYAINGFVFYLGWQFPDRAVDNSGVTMNFEKTDSIVGACLSGSPCQTKEYFTIDLNRKYISSHTKNGIYIKIYGKRGSSLINLPPAYVQGFDNYLKSNKL